MLKEGRTRMNKILSHVWFERYAKSKAKPRDEKKNISLSAIYRIRTITLLRGFVQGPCSVLFPLFRFN